MNFFAKKPPVVTRVSISKIDPKETDKLRKTLKKIKKGTTVAILATVNAGNGDGIRAGLVEADIVATILRQKANDCSIPLITYAEESVGPTALPVLLQGDNVLSHPISRLGNVGFTLGAYNLLRLTAYWRADVKYVTKGLNKRRLN